MVKSVLLAFIFVFSVVFATISVGPNGGVVLTPGTSKQVATNSLVYLSGQGVLSQIDGEKTFGEFVPQLFSGLLNSFPIQQLPTNGISDSVIFPVGTDWYLAVAQTASSSFVLKWNSSNEQFESWDILSSGAFEFAASGFQGVTNFTIGTSNYLAFAGITPYFVVQDATGHFGNSVPEKLSTQDYYLDVFPNPSNPASYFMAEASTTSASQIRQWNGADFNTIFQTLPQKPNLEIKHFVVANQTYLAVNNYNYNGTVDVYYWNGSSFAILQSLPAVGPRSSTFFQIGSNYYLAVAENGDGANTTNQISTIWQFSQLNQTFTKAQGIPTSGAWRWTHFTLAGQDFLGLANKYAYNQGFIVPSRLYIWTGLEFALLSNITTSGATSIRTFNSNGIDYLFATDFNSQYSILYRLTPI